MVSNAFRLPRRPSLAWHCLRRAGLVGQCRQRRRTWGPAKAAGGGHRLSRRSRVRFVCIQSKPVSDARFGDQVARVGGVRLQLPAQIGQVHPGHRGGCLPAFQSSAPCPIRSITPLRSAPPARSHDACACRRPSTRTPTLMPDALIAGSPTRVRKCLRRKSMCRGGRAMSSAATSRGAAGRHLVRSGGLQERASSSQRLRTWTARCFAIAKARSRPCNFPTCMLTCSAKSRFDGRSCCPPCLTG